MIVAGAMALIAAVACGTDDQGDRADATTSTTSSSTTSTTTTVPLASRRPFEVTRVERTYTRTAADGSARELLTEVWVPGGAGPFPLVAFAHGNDGHPRKFHELFDAWTAAGYAVVAPRFPVSADDANRDLAASVADGPQQTLDLEFVTAQVLAEAAAPGELGGRIDPDVVAVAGLSLGGGTALQASYGDCCPGLRPRLVIAFSPVPYETTQGADAAPLLLMHGTKDFSLPYQGSRDYFDTAANRRWFVTMPEAGHAQPYEDTPSPQDALVRSVSIAFLDQFLSGDDAGAARAEAEIAASGLATVESAG